MYVGGNCRWVPLTLVFCHSFAQCKGIRIQESGIHVPLKKSGIQFLESGIHDVESRIHRRIVAKILPNFTVDSFWLAIVRVLVRKLPRP